MADNLKMDPARIARLRDPARLKAVDPELVLDVVTPLNGGPILDVGAGVGYVSLPFARRLPDVRIIAIDILPGMLSLLDEAASVEKLGNLETALMPGPTTLPVADDTGGMLIMLQVHHELDDTRGLLRDCRRALAPGAPLVIVDWKDEDLPGISKGGRRVAQAAIVRDLEESGFRDIVCHDIFPIHSMVCGIA